MLAVQQVSRGELNHSLGIDQIWQLPHTRSASLVERAAQRRKYMDCMIRKSETKPCDKPGWESRLSRRVLTIAAVGSLLSVATSARAACGSFSQIGAGKQAHPASWNMQSGRAYLS